MAALANNGNTSVQARLLSTTRQFNSTKLIRIKLKQGVIPKNNYQAIGLQHKVIL
jgi:hypothetical protein